MLPKKLIYWPFGENYCGANGFFFAMCIIVVVFAIGAVAFFLTAK
jgi:hypothetical protein